MTTLLFILAILAGFGLLVWGADRFVDGASNIARNFGVSPLIVGLTIVGFGTSAPEMLVSGLAAFDGAPTLGVGNALGSNIANLGLVLGVTVLIRPLMVDSATLRREFPILGGIMLFALVLMIDLHLSKLDGVLLFAGFILLLFMMALLAMRSSQSDPLKQEFEQELAETRLSTKQATISFIVGLVTLLIGSKLLVWGAVAIATLLGMSELVIGLTIVAIGTSLPELAAAITSVLKAEPDIAIGNIIGSNMFNLLAVLAMPGLIMPTLLDPAVLSRDFLLMTVLTILLFVCAVLHPKRMIGRGVGVIMLGLYVGYNGLLAYQTMA